MSSGTQLSLWAVPQPEWDMMCPPASAGIHGARHSVLVTTAAFFAVQQVICVSLCLRSLELYMLKAGLLGRNLKHFLCLGGVFPLIVC